MKRTSSSTSRALTSRRFSRSCFSSSSCAADVRSTPYTNEESEKSSASEKGITARLKTSAPPACPRTAPRTMVRISRINAEIPPKIDKRVVNLELSIAALMSLLVATLSPHRLHLYESDFFTIRRFPGRKRVPSRRVSPNHIYILIHQIIQITSPKPATLSFFPFRGAIFFSSNFQPGLFFPSANPQKNMT